MRIILRRSISGVFMIRLPLLAAAVLLLPNFGDKPATVTERPAAVMNSASFGLPSLRLPKFLRGGRKRGVEQEIAQMNTRLRDLVVQQESWLAQNKVYGRNAARVAAVAPGDSLTNHVQVQILFANSKGWSAIASHPDAPGRSCVAFVGGPEAVPMVPRTRAEANVATMAGIPACDSK